MLRGENCMVKISTLQRQRMLGCTFAKHWLMVEFSIVNWYTCICTASVTVMHHALLIISLPHLIFCFFQ